MSGDARAQQPSGVELSLGFCRNPHLLKQAGNAIPECADTCKTTVFDDAFIKGLNACLSKADANPHRVAAVAGAMGALTSLPWVTIITDFFVARLKGEAALFLKERVADQLCPKGERKVTDRLLPTTCGVLRGEGGGVATLPAAFRQDVDDMANNLFAYVLELAKPNLSEKTRAAICVAAALPGPLAVLRKRGPYEALRAMTLVQDGAAICKAPVTRAKEVASWVLSILEDSVVKNPALSPAELERSIHEVSMSLLVGRVLVLQKSVPAPAAAELAKSVAELGEGWKSVEPLLAELIPLLEKIKNNGASAEHVVRAAELTMRIWVALLPFDEDIKGDLSSAVKAFSALANKRYLEGVLALFSIRSLDDYLSEHDKLKSVWKNLGKWAPVLGGLAEAKSAEDANAILEAAAAPLGSYREFTSGGWKGFISGWAGVGGGADWTPSGDNNAALALGPMLPIGVELGHPITDGGTSIQMLVSLIDVGALAVARFDEQAASEDDGMDEKVKLDPDPSLSSVFAPGLFLGVRFRDLPFVLSLGAEFLPKSIVKFDCDEGEPVCEHTRSVPTLRFMASVAFDLTAFRLF